MAPTISKHCQLNQSKLQYLNSNILETEEKTLCSVIGLQEALAHKLANLKPSVRGHQSDEYFLLCFLEEHGDYSEVDSNLKDKEAVSSELQEMGFTQSRSAVIANWIAEQPFAEHQSLLAWAQHYIKNFFMYDSLLNNHVPRFPYQEGNVNRMFSVPIQRDNDEGDVVQSNVRVINLSAQDKQGAENEMKHKIAELQEKKSPGDQFYFHGTEHKGAQSILENGINLGASKRHLDFSDGIGFYLTDCGDFAVEWSLKNKSCAILVFKISEQDLAKYKCCDLSGRKDDWDKVIKYHKKGKPRLQGELRKECMKCAYMKGPMTTDGIKCNPSLEVQQICIKKEVMAEFFGQAEQICCAIFAKWST